MRAPKSAALRVRLQTGLDPTAPVAVENAAPVEAVKSSLKTVVVCAVETRVDKNNTKTTIVPAENEGNFLIIT